MSLGGGAIVDYDNIIYDEQGGIIEIPLLNNGRMYSPKIHQQSQLKEQVNMQE